MDRMTDISIIIINWNTRQLLLDCIGSIYSTVKKPTFEIFVVDNGSTDGSIEAVAGQHAGVTVIANSRNQGFAKANNAAIRRMNGRYAVLLNSDTLLKRGAIDEMFIFMEANPRVGMCGPQLLFGDGSKQTSMGVFPDVMSDLVSSSIARMFRSEKQTRKPTEQGAVEVDFIIGACMFVRKHAIEQVGMLDEDYFFFYEEIDWCYRLYKNGWPVYHLPWIEIVHFGGQSTKNINLRARVESWRSRYIFFRKSRQLSGLGSAGLYVLGATQSLYRLLGYLVMNVLSLFFVGRLRKRWIMFAYVFSWHIKGRPVSMGLRR